MVYLDRNLTTHLKCCVTNSFESADRINSRFNNHVNSIPKITSISDRTLLRPIIMGFIRMGISKSEKCRIIMYPILWLSSVSQKNVDILLVVFIVIQ